jgi:AcrR family transcriptional regulator
MNMQRSISRDGDEHNPKAERSLRLEPTRRPLRREAAENRERLLYAAKQVFAVKGLDAGVDEIARTAGVGMGTFYRRFPTKQALIDELVADLRRRLLEVARNAQRADPENGLEALLYGAGQLQARDPGCMRFLWSRSHSEQAAVDEFLAILADLHARGQAAGRIRHDVSVTDVWVALWSLRGILEMTRGTAPNAWKRHLRVMIAGMSTEPVDALSPNPMTLNQAKRCIEAASR